MALREALRLGHSYIGTEHVLLGLIREGEETGVSVLVALGISPDDVRARVLELLGCYEKAEAEPGPAEAAEAREEIERLRHAALLLHMMGCDRCSVLALICPDCRKLVGECPMVRAIERLTAGEMAADGS